MGGNQSSRGAGGPAGHAPTPGNPNRCDVVRAIDAMWLEAAAAAAQAKPPLYDMEYHGLHHHHHHYDHHHPGCCSAVRRSASICASSTSSSSASERRRPRQRAPGPGDSPPPRPPPTPTPSTGTFPEASPESTGNTDETDSEAQQSGRLRRGQSLEVICEEVLSEESHLTKPVRRRRSELIPRARLVPRRAASAAGDIRFRNNDTCSTHSTSVTPQSGESVPSGFAWRHHHSYDPADLGMSRRPQVLHVTDSATTKRLYGRCASARGYLSESGRFEGERRYVSRSTLTLNGGGDYSETKSATGSLSRAHSFDDNLSNDRHYHKSRWSPAQSPHDDQFGEITEEEEIENGAQKIVEANNNYVTWTKSSGGNKHWALLVDPTNASREVTVDQEVVDNRVINRILREVHSENDSPTESETKKCVAVIAACPPPEDEPEHRSVSTVTFQKSGNRSSTTSSPFERNSQLRKSMSTVALSEREQEMRAAKPPKIPSISETPSEDRSKAETEFDGLLQYLHDYRHGLRELLVNHNVVIIEPVRASVAESETQQRKQNDAKNSNKTCRVTGAIIKTPGNNHTNITSSNTLPRSQKPHQPIMRRQFFYHPIKINKELVDAELPDPDTVKNARRVFEKGVKEGSEHVPKRSSNTDDKLARLLTVDTAFRQEPAKRWTDTGSLSSGVSSDLSCCETDLEASPRGCPPSCSNSSNQEVFSSGEDSEQEQQNRPAVRRSFVEDVGGNRVSEEVLQKIRACGTTVTYFGGRVISSSTGPLRSPMTMAIMDEIRRNAPSYDPTGTRFGMRQLGVKFRLVKSNSCGSRLELAGTEPGRSATKNNRVQRSNTTGSDMPPPPDKSKPKITPRKVEFPKETKDVEVSVKPEVKVTHAKETAIVAPTPAVRTIIPKKAVQESLEEKPKLQSIPDGDTEKNSPSETSMTSWKICKMLDDLKRTNASKHYIDNRPKPHLPPPGNYDKFGVMEFEEFEVLET